MAALAARGLGAALLIALLLSACGGRALRWEPRVHVVVAGETLHAIAFRYGLDLRELAAWNGIDNPDIIFAGQRLRLSPPPGAPVAATTATPGGATGAAPATGAGARGSGPPPDAVPALPVDGWQWPADGAVVAGYGAPTSLGRGVDVSGNQGDPVRAAAAGRVVYSGSGLLGYGNLIILKHNETYLSAYGHNETLLVGEGEHVRAGQRIATMGLGPGDRAVLHFEIRRKGKPVDPLRYLPER